MDANELKETDRLLRAAQLLKSSEAGFARDYHGRITEQADPEGEKLDWYSLGLLDALRLSRGYDLGRLRLLTYLMLLAERGPGEAAVRAAERLFMRLNQADPGRHTNAGRRAMLRMSSGKRTVPGTYAGLLAADAASGLQQG